MSITKGSIVYVNNDYNVAEKCIIEGFYNDEISISEDVYKVRSLDCGGTFGSPESKIFETKEEAVEAYRKEFKEEADKYMSEIKSLKDLLQFPLDHCINGEEYTDYAAKAAYCAKMKEFI